MFGKLLCPLIARLCRKAAAGAASSDLAVCSAGTSAAGRARPFPSGIGAPILGAPTPGKRTGGPAGPPQQVPTAFDL